ncbi:MAG: carboxypeptidase-like regulatory domain-containing protein [Candidatus Poseidoniia archaeon]
MTNKKSSNDQTGVMSIWKKRSERERRIDILMEIRTEYAGRAMTRTIVAVLIVSGSLMGLLSGFLLLSNNPDDLLSSSLFKSDDYVDISGHALHNESGEGVSGVAITLSDPKTGALIDKTTSDANGFYRFENMLAKRLDMTAVKDGFKTIHRTFTPSQTGEVPLTMHEGDGVEEEIIEEPNSILSAAVTVSTIVAIITILTAFIGLYAAHEARRGKRYRKTQYLAGISLCSRGFIIFGPILILMGMILMMMVKEQFADHAVDERTKSAGDDS